MPEDPLNRTRRVLRSLASGLWQGLIHYGFFFGMLPGPPPELSSGLASEPSPAPPSGEARAGQDPPPGHPERRTPHLPLTETEERLWRELGHP